MEAYSPIEFLAAGLGLVNVVLIVRQKVANYPFGIAMVILYAYIFYEYKLYSEASLQIVWIFMQLYGWWFWLYGNKGARDAVPVTRMGVRYISVILLAILLGTLALGYTVGHLTDAAVPYQDAFVTCLSLAAQWLLDRKKLETWILWIFIDVFSIGLYYTRGLYLTMGLYVAFLFLAISGLVAWRRSHRASFPPASGPGGVAA